MWTRAHTILWYRPRNKWQDCQVSHREMMGRQRLDVYRLAIENPLT
jgi:hypothetical protein